MTGARTSPIPTWVLALTIGYFAAFTIQYANIFDAFIPQATRLARVAQLVVVATFLLRAVVLGHMRTILWGFGATALLIGWHVLFCALSGVQPNFNTLLGYLPFLALVPIIESGVPLSRQFRLLFIGSAIYVIIYVLANRYLINAASVASDVSGVVNTGDDRGARVGLAALITAFAALYAYEDQRLHPLFRMAVVGAALFAIALSASRAFTAIFGLVFCLNAARLTGRFTATALSAIFLAVSALHLWGIVDPSWNPYRYMVWDKSSYGRYLEYVVAMRVVNTHWLFGLGIEPDGEALGRYLNVPNYLHDIYFGDLGALGPLGQFGILGLSIFMVASVASIASSATRSVDPGLTALRLTCLVSALYGVIAPSIIYPPSCFFTSALLGVWLRLRDIKHEQTRRVRSPTAAAHWIR